MGYIYYYCRVRLKGEPASPSLLKNGLGSQASPFRLPSGLTASEYEIYDTNSTPKLTCQKGTVAVMSHAAFLMTTELFKMELFKDLLIQ